MKLLDRDLETNGRTWLDPRGLDKLMPTGPYNAAAFLIVGPSVIATTGTGASVPTGRPGRFSARKFVLTTLPDASGSRAADLLVRRS